MKRPRQNNFNGASHKHAQPEVLFSNLTWQSQGQISSVLLERLVSAFSNRMWNDLLPFGNGNTAVNFESKSWLRWGVGHLIGQAVEL